MCTMAPPGIQGCLAPQQRRGLQLLELTVSMALASILLTGTATAIYLASAANGAATKAWRHSSQVELGIDQLALDLAQATRIQTMEPTYAALETLTPSGEPVLAEYRWPGSGGSLTISVDGASQRAITPPLDNFTLESQTFSPLPPLPATISDSSLYLQHFDSQALLLANSIPISAPDTMMPGDLLMIAGAISTADNESVVADPGWTKVLAHKHPTSNLTLCAFYRTTVPTAISSIHWSNLTSCYFISAQFRGASQELQDVFVSSGHADRLECLSTPEYPTPVNVIRVAASGCPVVAGSTNMLNFSRVGVKRDVLLDLTIAAAYANSQGGDPAGARQMGGSGPYITATMVFAK